MNYSKNKQYWENTAQKQKQTGTSLTHSDPFLPLLEREMIARQLSKNKTVLELGCGACDHSVLYMQASKQYTGVEFAHDFIDIGNHKIRKHRIKNAKLIRDDGYEYIENTKIIEDILITQRFIINLKDRETQLGLFRNIKKNGHSKLKIVICEGFTEALEALNKLRREMSLGDIKVAEYNNFINSAFMNEIASIGFRVEKVFDFNTYFFITRLFNTEFIDSKIDIQEAAYKIEKNKLCDIKTDISYSKIYVLSVI